MYRGAGILAGVALALSCACVPGDAFAGTVVVPKSAGFAYVRHSAAPPRVDVNVVDGGAGSRARSVAGSGEYAGPLPVRALPSWSPNGGVLAYATTNGASEQLVPPSRLRLVRADGTRMRALRGTRDAVQPVFLPDGGALVFARVRYLTMRIGPDLTLRLPDESWISLLRLGDGTRRVLARGQRGDFLLPTSASPSGRTVLGTRVSFEKGLRSDAVAVRRRDGRVKVIRTNASEPVFSPDGARIAMVRELAPPAGAEPAPPRTDLFVQAVDGSDRRRLTRSGASEVSHPGWDPSGERLGYTLARPQETRAAAQGFGGSLMQVNADGTCHQRIMVRRHAALFGPVWRPGPGRGAGRIECGGRG